MNSPRLSLCVLLVANCIASLAIADNRLDDPLAEVSVPPQNHQAATKEDTVILNQSGTGDQLQAAALRLASSDSESGLQTLGRLLGDAAFLDRLDTAQSYQQTYDRLRLGAIIKTLAQNHRQPAQQVLITLIDSPIYQKSALRIQLLARALAQVRPAPAEVIKYWDNLSAPESPLAFDVVESICVNQSQSALALLARKFIDNGYTEEQKLAWLRQIILPRRDNEALLLFSEQMLDNNATPQKLRTSLIETLFDFKPEWYLEDPPQPPNWANASQAAKQILQRVGNKALKSVQLSPDQKASVAHVLKLLKDQAKKTS